MHDTAENRHGLNEPVGELASVLKKPAVMQPLPEMPSESAPNVSAQQELSVPGDAISIQGIDPIITGPRAYKPRADAGRTASKIPERQPFTIWLFDLGTKTRLKAGFFRTCSQKYQSISSMSSAPPWMR
ncbi:hypothetical protein HED51_11655 [Ochrobactrum grignonense]|nr:hypothetical protein [Brucella grignonensis]